MIPKKRTSVRAVPSLDAARLRRETRARALRARAGAAAGAKRLMRGGAGCVVARPQYAAAK
jgi:hypothetical protein